MVFGPLVAAGSMDLQGPAGFALFLAIVHLGVGAFALYRMTRRSSVPIGAQGQHIFMPQPSPVSAALAQEAAVERQPEQEVGEMTQSPLASSAGQGYT
jgi:hypothetical protein